MDPNRDFREFSESFFDRDVRFLIGGGYARAAFGHPRWTNVCGYSLGDRSDGDGGSSTGHGTRRVA